MRSGDHLADAKMSKKAPSFIELNFLRIGRDENGFHRMKEEGQIYKKGLNIFHWVMIFQSLLLILPLF